MKVLVVGGGGREHALCWALSPSAAVFCAPGNPGTRTCATNLPVDPGNHESLIRAIRDHAIDLTVIGPEGPLAAGIVDDLAAAGHLAFGPTRAAARLESSKAFAKQLMVAAGIPTATHRAFTDPAAATEYIARHPEPLVVKASGLAGGKGAVVCRNRTDAIEAAGAMFRGRFGAAGATVIVEEFLEGEELSVFAMTDGEHLTMLPASQDHKRLEENDLGPNTGGMGAYAPVSVATDALLQRVELEILRPTLTEMARSGAPYVGFLYAGLMVSPTGDPSVVEFNCRLGDPEAQAVLPLLETPLIDSLLAIAEGSWTGSEARVLPNRAAVTTVLASRGYPASPEKGASISLPDLSHDQILFHAGTREVDGTLQVAGGRVLAATGLGPDVPAAAEASRRLAEAVEFDTKVYRRDIAWRETARAGAS